MVANSSILNGVRKSFACAAALSVLTTAIVLPGCGSDSGETASVAEVQSDLLLADKPESAISLTEVAEAFAPSEDSEEVSVASQEVTLTGRIDAGDFQAFQDDQATFMLSELPADGHGADDPDHEDNCPFCKRRAANAPKAIVNMVDEAGAILPTDARKLLGVSEGDRIVAVGMATFDDTVNTITLQCRGVYVDK
ncbi:signal peptide-domain containing protein [Rhodopirellula sallentina SM41]|uniref:Signal peptide-domain containing protein n=1 Tax=Rhodopirellula sallentina SM41 TaxID=1263870 RepID=M5U6T5_9BACT|nr:signal peptide-domain containing protein [Rhodopirellula sallentina SM41]